MRTAMQVPTVRSHARWWGAWALALPCLLLVLASSGTAMAQPTVPDVAAAFEFTAPIGADSDASGPTDESLADVLTVTICAVEGSSCTPVDTLTSDTRGAERLREHQGDYRTKWKVKDHVEEDVTYRITVFVGELPLGDAELLAVKKPAKGTAHISEFRTKSNLDIRFRIHDHPVIRAHALAERGASASAVAGQLAGEFGLDAATTSAVLAHAGYTAPEVVAVLIDLGQPLGMVAEVLRDVFGQDAAQVAAFLIDLGQPLASVAEVLVDVFDQTPAETSAILLQVSGDLNGVGEVLRDVFAQTPAAAAGLLIDLGQPLAGVGEVLRDAFAQTPTQAAAVLLDLGHQLGDVGVVLQQVFGQAADQVATVLIDLGSPLGDVAAVLRDVFDQTAGDAGAVLLGIGQDVVGVGEVLRDVFGQTGAEALQILLDVGALDLHDDLAGAAGWLVAVYAAPAEDVVAILDAVGFFALGDADAWIMTATWLRDQAGMASSEVLELLWTAGPTTQQAIAVITDVFSGGATEVATFFLSVGEEAQQVGAILRDELGLAADESLAAFLAIGASTEQLGDLLAAVYDQTAEEAAQLLADAGAGLDQIGAVLRTTYAHVAAQATEVLDTLGATANEIAAALRTAGYTFTDIGAALSGALGRTPAQVSQALSAAGATLDQVGVALRDGLGLTSTAIASTMRAVGVSFHDLGGVLHTGLGVAHDQIPVIVKAIGGNAVQATEALRSLSYPYIATTLTAATYTTNQIGGALQAFGAGPTTAALALKTAGHTSQQIAVILSGVFNQQIGQTASILRDTGAEISQTITALKAVYGDRRNGIVGALRQADYGIQHVISAIGPAFNVYGEVAITQALRGGGYAVDHVAFAFSHFLGLTQGVIEDALTQGGYAAGAVEGFFNNLGSTIEEGACDFFGC